jgi:uncharacterized repeat protein (TIGR02543 family)
MQTVKSGGSGSTVTAVADTGYRFVAWSDGVTTAGRTDSNVTANITVSAVFAADINAYTLTYRAPLNGSISGNATQIVSSGGSGTPVTAVANTGYRFASWSDGVTTATRTDTNVSANISVTASFVVNSYTLKYTTTPLGGGSVTANPSQSSYPSGAQVVLTAAPNTGYTFSGWSENASGTANPLTVTITGNTSITANFTTAQQSANIAPLATVTASTQNTSTKQTAVKAVDGVIDGYPGDYTKEWASL